MTFDLPTITALVKRAADKLLPGWGITVELAPSVDAIGALAYVQATPERKLAHVVVAPHPPHEDIWKSICHEMTHGVLSPLTRLIEYSPAAVMIEEQIVELLGNVIAEGGIMADAIISALRSPRANALAIRKRISALAVGRPGKERKRMLSAEQLTKALEALESGDPEATKAILKELIAAMATGGGDAGPASATMREDKPEDGKDVPPMREDQLPPQAREYMRQAKRAAQSALSDTIRLRLHTARTVDGIVLDPATEKDLESATSFEQFEREFKLVARQAARSNEPPRKRSGVEPEGHGSRNGSPSLDQLRREYPEQVANDIHRAFERGSDHGNVALKAAAKFRKAAQND